MTHQDLGMETRPQSAPHLAMRRKCGSVVESKTKGTQNRVTCVSEEFEKKTRRSKAAANDLKINE